MHKPLEPLVAVMIDLTAFRLDMTRRGLSDGTIRRRTQNVRALHSWAEPLNIYELTEEHIQTFLDQRRMSARTRYCWVSHLHTFFEYQVRIGATNHNPCAYIVRPKLRRNLPRPISEDDLTLAIRCADTEMKCWLLLAAFAGLRCAEIAGLQRSDILEDQRLLRIVGKGNVERLIPMHPDVIDALTNVGLPNHGNVFRRRFGGAQPPKEVSRLISDFMTSIDVDATAHQLRHYFATRIYAASKDLRVTQELLGHASPTTTAIYTAFSREDAAAAVAALTVGTHEKPAPKGGRFQAVD